jgi:hypothetical protein
MLSIGYPVRAFIVLITRQVCQRAQVWLESSLSRQLQRYAQAVLHVSTMNTYRWASITGRCSSIIRGQPRGRYILSERIDHSARQVDCYCLSDDKH